MPIVGVELDREGLRPIRTTVFRGPLPYGVLRGSIRRVLQSATEPLPAKEPALRPILAPPITWCMRRLLAGRG